MNKQNQIRPGAVVCLKEWFDEGGPLMTVECKAPYWDENGNETGNGDYDWKCIWFSGTLDEPTLNRDIFHEADLVLTNERGDYMRISLKINSIINDIISKFLHERGRTKTSIAPNN